jgi:glycosyltransferase involved in cell wall biosynthesis
MPDILFIISGLQIGGSERQLALLASALAEDGMTVAVYSFVDGPVRHQLEQRGIEVILPPGSYWRSSFGRAFAVALATLHLFWFMLHRRPRIAHFFLPAAYMVGAPLAWLARVPVRVMSRRSLNTYQRSDILRAVERLWHRAMHAILGNSRGVVDQLRAEGVAPDRLGLIYNGIDESRFAAAAPYAESRDSLGLPRAALIIGIVANLIPYKGHRDLFDALILAAPHLPPDWRLLVVGRDDGIGHTLQTQVQQHGLQDNVMFLGMRSDVAPILNASDIGVLCSHEEGFSNAILETMAAGLPMVVTKVGGNSEAVIDGETGFVVQARDCESLAAAIIRLAQDPALRAQFGAAGHQRVLEYFGLQRFVQSHRELYDALRAGRRPIDVPSTTIRG